MPFCAAEVISASGKVVKKGPVGTELPSALDMKQLGRGVKVTAQTEQMTKYYSYQRT